MNDYKARIVIQFGGEQYEVILPIGEGINHDMASDMVKSAKVDVVLDYSRLVK
jgi:hypothetical protein